MKRFVLDASVALAWFIDNPSPPYARHVEQVLLSGGQGVVPALWHLEMANGFVVAERRGILSAADVTRALGTVELLLGQAIESVTDLVSIRQTLATARTSQLSGYDAVYLNTAQQQQLPLASLDRRLIDAAARAHVPLLP